jgi:hypothetical protein
MQYLVGREVREIVRSVAYLVMPVVNANVGIYSLKGGRHEDACPRVDLLSKGIWRSTASVTVRLLACASTSCCCSCMQFLLADHPVCSIQVL